MKIGSDAHSLVNAAFNMNIQSTKQWQFRLLESKPIVIWQAMALDTEPSKAPWAEVQVKITSWCALT